MRRPGTKKKGNGHTSTAASRYCVDLSNITSYMRAYTIHGGQVLVWGKMSELPAIDLLEGTHARATCDEGGISAGGWEGGSDAAHA